MLCMTLCVLPASAQLLNKLNYGSDQPIVDEFGVLLQGTPTTTGALVQIMRANQGIFPPAVDGSANTNNPVLHHARVGEGIDPEAGTTGMFAGEFAIDRTVANTLFARIFNRPTLAESSFYTDSQIYVSSTTVFGEFRIFASQTSTELDPGDDDSDGLSNSMEKSLGTSSSDSDSDDDGVSDYMEVLAGTNPLDDESFLQMVDLARGADANLLVSWSSVSGKTYQVEYTTNSLAAAVVNYLDLYDPVQATGLVTSVTFTNGALLHANHFRVRLAP